MKMIEDRRLLARKQRIDEERRAQAVLRAQAPKIAKRNATVNAMARVAAAARKEA